MSDLQGTAEGFVSESGGELVHNPANPRASTDSDDSPDDWVDLGHLRALAVAAHALVAVAPERARGPLEELMRQLDAAGRGQRR